MKTNAAADLGLGVEGHRNFGVCAALVELACFHDENMPAFNDFACGVKSVGVISAHRVCFFVLVICDVEMEPIPPVGDRERAVCKGVAMETHAALSRGAGLCCPMCPMGRAVGTTGGIFETKSGAHKTLQKVKANKLEPT